MTVTRETLLKELDRKGFKFPDRLLHVFAGGSNQHGAQIPGKNDLDICGVFIETPTQALGLDREEHFVCSTSDEGSKNTSADVDFQLYTLRKWATLAVKGNPTVLSYLFMPPTPGTVWADLIYPNRYSFLASSHAKAFLGFALNQLRRLKGELGAGKHGQRPDAHGYDTKAAMHMIRMMHECLELLSTGGMTFPRPEVQELLDIRNGLWAKSRVESWFKFLEGEVLLAEKNSLLPRHVNRILVSQLITRAYLEHWAGRQELPRGLNYTG